MDMTPFRHQDRITVARPPADLYAIVSDIGRMGELSPMCTSGTWDDPAQGAAAGSWFTGSNAIGDFTWDTRCRVEVAEPTAQFTFTNCGGAGDGELAQWGYTFTAADGGTEVTETWQVQPGYADFVRSGKPDASDEEVAAQIDGMATMAREGMSATLANLKRIAES